MYHKDTANNKKYTKYPGSPADKVTPNSEIVKGNYVDLTLYVNDPDFAAFVASDAHTSVVRTPWMRDVQELLRREYSPRVARLLTKEHAEKVLGNETIEMDEPDWFD